MNADDATLTELPTAHNESTAEDSAPDAPALPSFDYAQVVKALPGTAIGSASTPHGLTIAAQLAATLRPRTGSGEIAPNRAIPSESTLAQQYGVTQDTARKALQVLADEGLVM
jgi:hypothetical protein